MFAGWIIFVLYQNKQPRLKTAQDADINIADNCSRRGYKYCCFGNMADSTADSRHISGGEGFDGGGNDCGGKGKVVRGNVVRIWLEAGPCCGHGDYFRVEAEAAVG